MITWGDVVEIIKHVFDIDQAQLAKSMNCNKSIITRIKRGEQSPPFGADQLFSLVFDPDTSDGPASKGRRKSSYWLDLVKEEIESNFKEVWKEMEDCWDEKDYRSFVLTLLVRAKKGPPTNQSSTDCDESPTPSDRTTGEGRCMKQGKVSLGKTAFQQMVKIFEQSVADYNIAAHICKLTDYLNQGGFRGGDIFEFIEIIQSNVLSKYVSKQNEEIYKKISEFNHVLDTYAHFLCMITSAISQKYGMMLNLGVSYDEIIKTVDSDVAEIKTNLGKRTSMKEDGINESSISMLEGELNQLSFIRSVLGANKQLCELFGEICPGKTILVF